MMKPKIKKRKKIRKNKRINKTRRQKKLKIKLIKKLVYHLKILYFLVVKLTSDISIDMRIYKVLDNPETFGRFIIFDEGFLS